MVVNKNLRDAGLKVTLPRANILQILENVNPRHLSAEDIYQILLEQGFDIGLATVYRVLTQFEEAGLVKRHHFASSQALFELEQGKHHDHLVCMKCNAIEEFVDEVIEQRQIDIAKKNKFKITDHSFIIYVFCQAFHV